MMRSLLSTVLVWTVLFFPALHADYEDGVEAAAAGGATTVDGIEVLVQQGAIAFEQWTGHAAPVELMRAAALAG